MDLLINELTPYLMIILTAIVGYIATKIKAFIDTKIDVENQKRLMNFIRSTVDYVEQIGINLNSEDKLNLAKAKIILWANAKGIVINEGEIDVLIEAFVHNLTKTSDFTPLIFEGGVDVESK